MQIKPHIALGALLIAAIAAGCCGRKPTFPQSLEPPCKEIDLSFVEQVSPLRIDSLFEVSTAITAIAIDGGCSVCIGALLRYLNEVPNDPSHTYLYVVVAQDLLLVEYFIEARGCPLHENEHLVLDKRSDFAYSNPLIDFRAMPIATTDRNRSILKYASLHQ